MSAFAPVAENGPQPTGGAVGHERHWGGAGGLQLCAPSRTGELHPGERAVHGCVERNREEEHTAAVLRRARREAQREEAPPPLPEPFQPVGTRRGGHRGGQIRHERRVQDDAFVPDPAPEEERGALGAAESAVASCRGSNERLLKVLAKVDRSREVVVADPPWSAVPHHVHGGAGGARAGA